MKDLRSRALDYLHDLVHRRGSLMVMPIGGFKDEKEPCGPKVRALRAMVDAAISLSEEIQVEADDEAVLARLLTAAGLRMRNPLDRIIVTEKLDRGYWGRSRLQEMARALEEES